MGEQGGEQQRGNGELKHIVGLTDFKFSVNISTSNTIKLIPGAQFPDVGHCPIALLANKLCRKFKKRKCCKEKFNTFEDDA